MMVGTMMMMMMILGMMLMVGMMTKVILVVILMVLASPIGNLHQLQCQPPRIHQQQEGGNLSQKNLG